jgi:PST family polysaccharide transporter
VFWSYGSYAVQFLIQAVALVVLARQLGARDFGVFALGLMIVGIGDTLFRMGFGPSIVQLKEVRDEHIDVAWTSNLLISLTALTLLGTGTFFFVPDPTARTAVLVMLIAVLLNALMSPGLLLMQRNLQTRDCVIPATARAFLRYVGAIVLSLWIKNHWALIIAYLCGFALEVALTYVIARRAPRLLFRRDIFLELFRFSRWLHLRNILRWAARYLDSSAVGALLGLGALGVYNRALNLACLPNQQTELLSYRIFFPMFASAQGQPERLRRLVSHAVNVLLLTALPILLIMALHGAFLIRLVLGSKWDTADSVLGLLALGLLLRSLNDLQATALRAVGEPRFEFLISVVQLGLTGLALVPCIMWRGLPGAALALIIGSGAGVVITERFMRRRIGVSIATQLGAVGGAVLGALAACATHAATAAWGRAISAEVLRSAAEIAAFFAVQLAIFLASRGGMLRTLVWAGHHFLSRQRPSAPATLQPQSIG